MMGWNQVTLLWLLASLPLWIAVAIWAAKTRIQRFKKVGLMAGTSRFRLSRMRLVSKEVILLFALSALVVAAAGPRWGWRWIESRQMGLDILVAVDVSRSMEARDLDPSRIERARRLVMDLLDVAEGDRIGLVAFAGDAFVQCPLTNDFGAVRMFLDVLNTDLIPVQGTDMAEALKIGLKALTTGGEGQGKFMIILSDGEDHNSKLAEATEDVKKSGVKVITIGMAGTAGAPIPTTDGSFKKDREGNVVISKLDESTLKGISDATGGFYLRADDAHMDRIYREGIRGVGTERETRASKEKVWFERYQWFAGLALLLLLLEGTLRDVRKVAILALCLGGLIAPRSEAAPSDLDQYNAAVKSFEDGKMDEAIKGFEAAAQSSDLRVRQRSTYNLGNAKSAKGDLEGAKKAWEEALGLDPQDQQVRENLSWVKKRQDQKDKQDKKDDQKKQKDQQKQDQKNPGDDKNKDQNKDGKNQDQDKKDQKSESSKQNDPKNQDQKNQDQKQNDPKNLDQKNQPSPGPSPGASSSPDPQDPDKKDGKGDGGEAKDVQKPNDMSKQDAEKLLRMVPDDLGKFYHPPSSPQKPRTNDQDW